jgi:hypothetical protein
VVVVMDGVVSKNCQEVHEQAHFNGFIASRYLTTCTRLLFCFFVRHVGRQVRQVDADASVT